MKKIFLCLLVVLSFASISLTLVEAEETTTVELVDGAQIRTDGYTGLKWVANVTNHTEGNVYGFVFAQGEVENLTVETSGAINQVVDGVTTENPTMSVTMVKFPQSAAAQDISVRAYVKVGETYTYSQNTVVRNLAEVALGAKNLDLSSTFIENIVSYIDENYKKMFICKENELFIDSAIFETRPEYLEKVFIEDWNKKFGTDFTNFICNQWQESACDGEVPINDPTDVDCTGTNIYNFFVEDEITSKKWGWLVETTAEVLTWETSFGGEISVLLTGNNGMYPHNAFVNLAKFFDCFFEERLEDEYNSKFNLFSTLIHTNHTIYAVEPNLIKIGDVIKLPVLNDDIVNFLGWTYEELSDNYRSTMLVGRGSYHLYGHIGYNMEYVLNGGVFRYSSREEVVDDFMKDLNKFLAEKDGYYLQADGTYATEDGTLYIPLSTPYLAPGSDAEAAKEAIGGINGEWFNRCYNKIASSTSSSDSSYYDTFIQNDEMWNKWSWLFEYMNIYLEPVNSAIDLTNRIVPSIGNFIYTIWGFLAEAPLITGWPSSRVNWSNGSANYFWSYLSEHEQKNYKYKDVPELIIPFNYGYDFEGWYFEEDFSGEPLKIVNKSCTLYAKFVTSGSISYELNGGVIDVTLPSKFNYGEVYDLPIPTKDDGSIFLGWVLDETSDDYITQITDKMVKDLNITIYAKWTKENNISYELKGGKFEGEYETTYVEKIGLEELPVPVKESYYFLGWTKDEVSTEYITSIDADETGDITLYAQWTMVSNINYVLNDGEFEGEYSTTYVETIGLEELPVPVKERYYFLGWTKDKVSTEYITSIDADETGDITLYAKWAMVSNINYVLNDGEFEGEYETTYVETIGLSVIPTPIKAGYAFLGWTKEEVSTDYITSIGTDEIGDITLYAQWGKTYNVTFVLNGGNFKYDSRDALVQDFVNDYSSVLGKGYTSADDILTGNFSEIDYHTFLDKDVKLANGQTPREKWLWLAQYLYELSVRDLASNNCNVLGLKALINQAAYSGDAIYGISYAFRAFLKGTIIRPGTSFTSVDFTVYDNANGFWNHLNNAEQKVYSYYQEETLPIAYLENYVFEGWYLQEDFSGNAITIVNSDYNGCTLYAKFVEDSFSS